MSRTGKPRETENAKTGESPEKNVYLNRKAKHEYFLMNSFEAGIALVGSEVKSVRQGNISLQDSYAVIENGEAHILNMHISPYDKSSHFLPDPKRKRKLLLHKSEIKRLMGKVAEKGLTMIPMRVYLVRGRVKLEIALARGKPKRDRRYDITKRDAEREIRKLRSGRS
ncbi:MAG: SsrA-binding protein SmpB [Candidatus Eisenbacteria bacterium]